jgi:L-fuculose-phosphate aldolase
MHENLKSEVLKVAKTMLERGMVIGSSGNVSVRKGEHVVVTPSSVPYSEMERKDIIVVDLQGEVIHGHLPPSTETATHIEIYKNREDAKAIVHSHSIYATALATIRNPLPVISDEIAPYLGGEIRVSEYAMAGTTYLAKNVVKALEGRSAVLLASHGALCIGKTLKEAFSNAILLERACQVYSIALGAGEPHLLPPDVVEEEAEIWKKSHT